MRGKRQNNNNKAVETIMTGLMYLNLIMYQVALTYEYYD